MGKVHFLLRILSVVILLGPLVGIVCVYAGNPSGLVLTPELRNLSSSDMSKSAIQLPVPAGTPQYDSGSGVYTFSFSYTNPLENEISVDRISAQVYCIDHGVELGRVSMDHAISIRPGETVTIETRGTWTQQALDHFASFHCGPEDDDIHVEFRDLNVKLAGVEINMKHLDAGWVMMP